ncbi:MAG: TolC family protein, partial [Bacteroidota bacterium]
MMPIDMKCIRNTFVFLVVLGTTLPLPGFGQENKSSFSMTIPQAVAFAIENHPDVKNANLEIAVASAKISELIAVGLPQVNLGIDVNNFVEIPTQFVPAEFFGGDAGTYAPVKFGQPWSSSAGVTASQLLFDGSFLIGVKATKVYKELSEKTAEQLKIEMAVNITKSYYMVLVATEKSKQLKGDLEQLDKIRRDTKKLYEKGFAEKVDLDRLDLNYNLLENAISHTDRMVVDGYNLLKFQMGMDLQHELILTEPVPEASNFNSLAETTGIDYNQRIEYSILKTQYHLTELDFKRYQSMRWPSVVAFGSYSTNASRNEFNLLQSGYKWYPTSIVG